MTVQWRDGYLDMVSFVLGRLRAAHGNLSCYGKLRFKTESADLSIGGRAGLGFAVLLVYAVSFLDG